MPPTVRLDAPARLFVDPIVYFSRDKAEESLRENSLEADFTIGWLSPAGE